MQFFILSAPISQQCSQSFFLTVVHITIIASIFSMKIPTPGFSLSPSSTISTVQRNFRALAASMGTGDTGVTLRRAAQAKAGAGCRKLVTLPSFPSSPRTTQTLTTSRGKGCVSPACYRQCD